MYLGPTCLFQIVCSDKSLQSVRRFHITGPFGKECADLWPRIDAYRSIFVVVDVVVVTLGLGKTTKNQELDLLPLLLMPCQWPDSCSQSEGDQFVCSRQVLAVRVKMEHTESP